MVGLSEAPYVTTHLDPFGTLQEPVAVPGGSQVGEPSLANGGA